MIFVDLAKSWIQLGPVGLPPGRLHDHIYVLIARPEVPSFRAIGPVISRPIRQVKLFIHKMLRNPY